MNLLSLLDTIGGAAPGPVSPEVAATLPTGRRVMLRSAGQASVRALAAALPLALTLPALAASTAETISDSLRLLLTLTDLQEALYTKALATPPLVPSTVRAEIDLIRQQHQQQAAFLRGLFERAGTTKPPVATFDFSGSHYGTGPVQFAEVFTTFDKFLQLAQPVADAAARIYQGQLMNLNSDNQLLDAMIRRQAVEARHASHLRTLRRNLSNSLLPKSWPSPTDPAVPAALATIQASEDNLKQLVPGATAAGDFSGARYINFIALSPDTPVRSTSLAEAFDEPLSTQQAVDLLALFQ
jgi:hypothetical protein